MFKKAIPARDAFTFSLGGMTTIASFLAAPSLADDRINKARDARLDRLRDQVDQSKDPIRVQQQLELLFEDVDPKWPVWLRNRKRAASANHVNRPLAKADSTNPPNASII